MTWNHANMLYIEKKSINGNAKLRENKKEGYASEYKVNKQKNEKQKIIWGNTWLNTCAQNTKTQNVHKRQRVIRKHKTF